ncbi:TraR/DksA C4-type zinc finger protein [Saccharopolyspora sp. NPDC047091]|uniref:TraR/DksA family transcriptional regulator n=1 Tax=Saccharopolyspora sp. NPDC047091 TaxID=3155924 RepID=UPI0033C89B1E
MAEWDAAAALSEARAEVEARIGALRRQLGEIREVSSWTGADDEHDPEGQTIAFERAQVQGLLDDARRELVELDRAAVRVEDGTYGCCERCGAPIGDERLAALPAAATCIGCASRARK